MSRALGLLLALAACACKSTSVEPIVIDLSRSAPSPTPSSQPLPTLTPTPLREVPAAPSPVAAAPSRVMAAQAEAAAQASGETAEAVVQRQLAAYNRRDLEEFVSGYSEDAIVFDPPDRIRDAGIEAIRRACSKAFADGPNARSAVSQRFVQGNFVIDRESVSGLPGGETRSAVVIYEVRDGKIRRVWILR